MLALLPGLLLLHGQTPPKPAFEVASIRASAPPLKGERRLPETKEGGPGTPDPGRLRYANIPVDMILADAFDVYWDQITGPDWTTVERFDIEAKIPEGTTKQQAREMLQNLFAERFHLTFHMQTKVVPGYELTLAPGGAKLKEFDPNAPPPAAAPGASADKDEFPILPPGVHYLERHVVQQGQGHQYARFAGTSMPEFAAVLATIPSSASPVMLSSRESRGAPTPVLDKTGLTGIYDFTFDWAGSRFIATQNLPIVMGRVKSSLEKQLGLKLVEAKVAVTTLVIDHIDRAPGN
jgi:uncharacterized protein (TIGR03435 family)